MATLLYNKGMNPKGSWQKANHWLKGKLSFLRYGIASLESYLSSVDWFFIFAIVLFLLGLAVSFPLYLVYILSLTH